ncbi:MAG: hypothetical protein ISS56_01530 [Anaerolineae bacterium]|nr:hypothetical protein [Anaerolineae bacterium]
MFEQTGSARQSNRGPLGSGATSGQTSGRSGFGRGLVIAILVLAGIGVIICLALAATTGFPFALRPSQDAQADPTKTTAPTSTHTPEPEWPATWTPTPTSTPRPNATSTPVPPPPPPPPGSAPYVPRPGTSGQPSTGGPLMIDFSLEDRSCPTGGSYVADFTIWAAGGDGNYTFYRDIDLIAGPVPGPVTYRVNWRDCGGAPGTFFVESGDGQRASKLFWVYAPDCCG